MLTSKQMNAQEELIEDIFQCFHKLTYPTGKCFDRQQR